MWCKLEGDLQVSPDNYFDTKNVWPASAAVVVLAIQRDVVKDVGFFGHRPDRGASPRELVVQATQDSKRMMCRVISFSDQHVWTIWFSHFQLVMFAMHCMHVMLTVHNCPQDTQHAILLSQYENWQKTFSWARRRLLLTIFHQPADNDFFIHFSEHVYKCGRERLCTNP